MEHLLSVEEIDNGIPVEELGGVEETSLLYWRKVPGRMEYHQKTFSVPEIFRFHTPWAAVLVLGWRNLRQKRMCETSISRACCLQMTLLCGASQRMAFKASWITFLRLVWTPSIHSVQRRWERMPRNQHPQLHTGGRAWVHIAGINRHWQLLLGTRAEKTHQNSCHCAAEAVNESTHVQQQSVPGTKVKVYKPQHSPLWQWILDSALQTGEDIAFLSICAAVDFLLLLLLFACLFCLSWKGRTSIT